MGAPSLESHEGSSESRGAGCGKDLSSSGPSGPPGGSSSCLSPLIFPASPVDKLFLAQSTCSLASQHRKTSFLLIQGRMLIGPAWVASHSMGLLSTG